MAKNGPKMQKTGHKNEFLAIFPFFHDRARRARLQLGAAAVLLMPGPFGFADAEIKLFGMSRGHREGRRGVRKGLGRLENENLAQNEVRSAPEPKNRIFFR